MKNVLRMMALLAIVAALVNATAPTPVSALSSAEMAVVGGSACSFAQGFGVVLGFGSFIHPGFGAVALGIEVGAMFFC